MYSEDDLNTAIEQKIFTQNAVDEFRQAISNIKNSPSVDEENFRLVNGFNDIFVVIAICLLLFSSIYVLKPVNDSLASFSFVALSWILSEFFVLKRKMSLPAIVLLIAFVGGIFSATLSFFKGTSEPAMVTAAALATVGAYTHWLRFKVPITVAAGTVALIGTLVSVILSVFPDAKEWILALVAICGIGSFFLAMYWDSADLTRTTRKADVAFWLHLISAPLIIHPLFSMLGVLEGDQSIINMAGVIVLYIIMSLISIAIDRRAFMVSSLAYVLYALTTILKNYGDVDYSFAVTGVFMGALLLLLSAFWQVTRRRVVSWLPVGLTKYVPNVVN
ncbi:hypothetical protein LP316_13875 [Thalassotalea sp. LPB0316]|uniref:hypothetical protein n=1 Tax=Thalassotalea sp. LPB0316 TaxID=2769490 RepID=UPI001866E8CA|nr:hypothetical protein [Thalassotalea sp. LPB0316]QOL25370.1 hypothetical protein LP316_13875 [Thalassotalea sp. LPB0316]